MCELAPTTTLALLIVGLTALTGAVSHGQCEKIKEDNSTSEGNCWP